MTDDLDERHWATIAAKAADERLGTDILVVQVGDVLAITEYFVIASGNNARQVKAIAEEVEHQVADQGGPKPNRVEGLDSLDWVLLDYGAFVVHVFSPTARDYYQLERLWNDQPTVDWQIGLPAAGQR